MGVCNAPSRDHQNHFHIYLKPPVARQIESSGNNLETDAFASIDENQSTQITEDAMMDAFIHATLTDFDKPAIIQVADNTVPSVKDVTSCSDVMLFAPKGANAISLFNHSAFKSVVIGQKTAVIKLIQAPKFGSINFNPDYTEKGQGERYLPLEKQAYKVSIINSNWFFDANIKYQAKDRAVFEIEAGQQKFRLTVNFWISAIPEEAIDTHTECKKRNMHLPDQKASVSVEQWYALADLSAYLGAASGVSYSFSDLPAGAVGNTVGTGASAQITLDTTAAGHGWYVDATPL